MDSKQFAMDLNSRMREDAIISAIRNSPKGQLRYDTGWDQNPHGVWQLVSAVQREEDEPKLAVLERAVRLSKSLELEEQQWDNEISPVGTSSGSGSRITLLEDPINGYTHVVRRHGNASPKQRRKGYGIREDEYDDEEMSREFEMQRATDARHHIKIALQLEERERNQIAEEKSKLVKQKIIQGLEERLAKIDLQELESARENSRRKLAEICGPSPELEAEIMAAVNAKMIILQQENAAIDRYCEEKFRKETEQMAIKQAQDKAVAARLEAEEKANEERQAQAKLQKEKADAEESAKQQQQQLLRKEEEVRKQRETELIADAAKKAEEVLQQAEQEETLPRALQGLISKESCDKYMSCNNLITKYDEATRDITASSPEPIIRKFYSTASRCINTPLNAVANRDPQEIAIKTTHFLKLIEGQSVVATPGAPPFSSSSLPNGQAAVIRLLAFRFVKKAEQEIMSEKKGFIPLANIAFSVAQKFPDWGSLIQAYFYKFCPFLVPFSFPRGNQSLQEYCDNLGYDLKGTDATLLNCLLSGIKGYCSLYAIMVQTFEQKGSFYIGEATPFFTLGGVWEILTRTVKLEPQPDVTVMVIQTLLELLSPRLHQVYGKQFQKFMGILVSYYLPKIDSVSTGASKSGVARFQIFIEQQCRRPIR